MYPTYTCVLHLLCALHLPVSYMHHTSTCCTMYLLRSSIYLHPMSSYALPLPVLHITHTTHLPILCICQLNSTSCLTSIITNLHYKSANSIRNFGTRILHITSSYCSPSHYPTPLYSVQHTQPTCTLHTLHSTSSTTLHLSSPIHQRAFPGASNSTPIKDLVHQSTLPSSTPALTFLPPSYIILNFPHHSHYPQPYPPLLSLLLLNCQTQPLAIKVTFTSQVLRVMVISFPLISRAGGVVPGTEAS